MPLTDPTKPLCNRCGKRNAQVIFKGLCQRCYTELRQIAKTPLDALGNAVAAARTDSDWKNLAAKLAPTIEAIAKGELAATAAQAALLKTIMDRAYGRVTKSQEDAKGPIGVVVLPVLNTGASMQICPRCLEAHQQHSDVVNE